MGPSLELCSCSRKLSESWLQKLFNKNNYPLVQFHCIIKIMCQDLPLGYLHCLLVCAVQDRNFGCSARFYIFYWNAKRFWLFLHCLAIQIVHFSNFGKNFGVPEVWWMFILLQTVMFKTYSIFDALFCLFWWNYWFYRWYKPWRSYNTVATMQKQIWMGF